MDSIASRKFSAMPKEAASAACARTSSASSAVGMHSASVVSSSSVNMAGPPLPPVPRMKSFTCAAQELLHVVAISLRKWVVWQCSM